MESTNPGVILQRHGIEVGMDDPRKSEEILADCIRAGHIPALETDQTAAEKSNEPPVDQLPNATGLVALHGAKVLLAPKAVVLPRRKRGSPYFA